MAPIYLDYNASTPIDPRVAAVMMPFLADHFGNPSSGHWAAAPAKAALENARLQIAALLGCEGDEVVFTSGGSEANNLALKGVYFARRNSGDHIITTRIEHPAIIEPCRFLERLGARITCLPVDRFGRVDPDDLSRAITPRTILISIMHANNEVGTIQPIEDCARIAREYGVPFHTDAAQSVGKIATDVNGLGADLLSIAGHKLYAPKGVGVLFVRRGVSLEPLIHGGGHEGGRRAGTERARYWRSVSARLASWRVISRRWIGCAPCATTSGSNYSRGSAIASRSTATLRIVCRTRSMFPSLAASVPRYWNGWTASPPQQARRAIRGASSYRPSLRR